MTRKTGERRESVLREEIPEQHLSETSPPPKGRGKKTAPPLSPEERLAIYAEERRAALEALGVAASLARFDTGTSRLEDLRAILKETENRANMLVRFKALTFYLVDESDSSFYQAYCSNLLWERFFEEELQPLIDDRTFAWAISRERCVIVSSKKRTERMLLHVLATPSRTRGMFVAVLDQDKKTIRDHSLSLLSVVMFTAAAALESFFLYKNVRELNAKLVSHIQHLETTEKELARYRNRLEEEVGERTVELQKTNRRLREEIRQHQETERSLAESRERFRALVENSSDVVWEMDGEGRFTYVSPKLEELLGISPEKVLGMRFYDTFDCGEEERERFRIGLEEIKKRGDPFTRVECAWRAADGRRFFFEASGQPFFDEGGTLAGYRGVSRDVTEAKSTLEQMAFQATHDPLTSLPNRALFADRLDMALALARRKDELVAVFFLDLDGFKTVNDSLGHDVGDRLLVSVANRLREQIRDMDTVSRMGGDEFTFIFPGVHDRAETARIAERILAAVAEEIRLESEESAPPLDISVTASIGIAVFPWDGEDVQTLMKRADAALYRAKVLGRNAYRFWNAQDTEVFGEIVDDAMMRKRLEEHLQETREFLDAVINAVGHPIFMKNEERRYVLANDTYCRWIGRPREEILGKLPEDLFSAEDAAAFSRTDLRVLETGESITAEEKIAVKTGANGKPRTVLISKSPYTDAKGRRYVVGSILDITGRKAAEYLLSLGEHNFRAIFDQAANPMVILDPEGHFLAVNSATLRNLGYTREEFLRLTPRDLVPEGHHCLSPENLAVVCTKGSLTYETVQRRRDGTLVPVETHAARIVFDGRPAVLALNRFLKEDGDRNET
ncbi:PAS domain S-box protein [Aminiphilus sp.]|uniref:PAS domain S-box protein n=1 Tax=Aminiphilus sp. TaxID=1872488 RepID=UPI002621DF81|nr:PAS domain S-box protein [Aminiphilus sp.]